MNNKAKCALAFMVGVAIGSIGTWKFAEEKYKRIAQEEIDSVKEVWARKKNEATDESESSDESEESTPAKTEVDVYDDTVKGLGYKVDEYEVERNKGEKLPMDRPYVISPDEFGEISEYELATLIYYADGVLEDNFGDIVNDIEETIGRESLDHFGEYGEDTVFVRNDSLKTDYEIAYDVRRYVDVPKITPYSHGE